MEQLIQEVFDKLEDVSCRIDDGTQTNDDIDAVDKTIRMFIDFIGALDKKILSDKDYIEIDKLLIASRNRLEEMKVEE